MRWRSNSRFFRRLSRSAFCASVCLSRPATLASAPRPRPGFFGSGASLGSTASAAAGGGSSSFMSSAIVIQSFFYTSGCCGSRDDTRARRRVAVGTYMGMYLCIVFFNSNFNDLKVTVEGPGVPILSRLSESPSCWHLRVTLTPGPGERPTTSSSGYRDHHDRRE